MEKIEKIRRRRITRNFNYCHDALFSASRYVMRETEGMFQSIYMDINEWWDIRGTASVRVYVMYNGKMYRSYYALRIYKKDFDNMREQDISPERYYKAILASEVLDLYAKIISEEDQKCNFATVFGKELD